MSVNNNIFDSKESFFAVIRVWKESSKYGRTALDHMVYSIARGKHPRNGFTEITSVNKLTNGVSKWQAYDECLNHIANTKLSSEITEDKDSASYKRSLNASRRHDIGEGLLLNDEQIDGIIAMARESITEGEQCNTQHRIAMS